MAVKAFEERSPRYQRFANRVETYVLGGFGVAMYAIGVLFLIGVLLAFIATILRSL